MYIEKNNDTIYAPATIPGTGAISVIRVSGPEALAIADKVIRCGSSAAHAGPISSARGYTIKFGTVIGTDGKVLDEVLVSIFRAPHSYTGENSVEISCHASSYIAGEIMSLLAEAGARAAAPGEFTQRAFLNGKMDLAQAEAVADVIASQNATAHRVAFNQMKGGFSSELKSMRSELLEMVSLMELELDFSEEDVEFADRTHLLSLLDRTIAHIGKLSDSFRLGNAIKNGVPVAIVGATNAGKSTLLNALLGEERAIVSDIHGTTRDTIEETLNIDGVLFRFIDTAGLRETSDIVEKIGIERSYSKLHSAQIVLGVLDGSGPEDEMCKAAEAIISQVNFDEQKLWLLVNKCDLDNCMCRESQLTDADGNGHQVFNEVCDESLSAEKPMEIETAEKNGTASNVAHTGRYFENEKLAGFIVNKNVITLNNIVSQITNENIGIISISAKSGAGLERLRNELASSQKDLLANQDSTLVTNLRHYEALLSAATSLSRVQSGLSAGIPTDLAAQDIREALYTLGSIIGEISTDEVLGNIFRNFCIGK
ncbi:MAG: tRNA uridine-5-carboxymethylaminomethyl(34) synthesis GTPase MnmE [Bacteroidales bacterium]|nr:tRNA uridine-5-carboxymethylaminomethyl(34) synthesis GTPase MnmE [Bacteroidales bacterium]